METTKQMTTKTKKPVKTFRDLGTWQAAYDLAIAVCRQCEAFPEHEHVLTAQITDTAAAICSNIAEGFGRRTSMEKDCFFESAQSLLIALDNQLLIAHGLGYIGKAQYDDLARRNTSTHWILVKLQKLTMTGLRTTYHRY